MSTTPSIVESQAPTAEQIAGDLEHFIRSQFDVPDDDADFGREVDLWEEGYVDSAGVVEVVAHLEERWGVKIPEEALFDPRFTRIRGMAEVVAALAA
jgi:acyl carrier protein